MKTHNNLYCKICSIDNLKLAFKKAKKGKSQMPYVKEFEANVEANVLRLKRELENKTYEPKPLRIFAIRDPKTRLISAPHFRDRVIHHALCDVIEPIFDKTFIHDSYASRKGKGTHAALRRFDYFKHKISCNGRVIAGNKDRNMVIGYYLKADIRHYFASVDHDILLGIINRKVKDENLMWLVAKILDCYDQCGTGKGMPIGSLTSQLFANIYLNELDYFVKHELKAKHYIRYMDDFVVLHKSKETLFLLKDMIDGFLESELRLELHPKKTNIFPLHKGVNLLGYRIFYHHKLLKKSNVRIMERRLMEFYRLHEEGTITESSIRQSVESWIAYADYADSYNMRMKLNAITRLLLRPRASAPL